MRPFGWIKCYRGITAGCSPGGKVGDISGRWVTFPCMYQLPCCRHLPDEAKVVTAALTWVLRCFTSLGRAKPSSHRGSSEKPLSKRTQETQPDGKGETLELFHPAGSTSITRWECCTPGEPLAELSAQGGSGATAENSPAVYFSFSSPVPLPGINA